MRHKALFFTAVALIAVGLLGIASSALFLELTDRDDDERPTYRRQPRTQPPDGWSPHRRGPRGPDGGDGFGRRHFSTDPDDYAAVGERIFYTGYGSSGRIPREPAAGPAMMGGCAICHGRWGEGRTFRGARGPFRVPDIRYSTLTSPRSEDGTAEPAWTDEDIGRAVREGVEPDGTELSEIMPRWEIGERDFAQLLGFLKTLDTTGTPSPDATRSPETTP